VSRTALMTTTEHGELLYQTVRFQGEIDKLIALEDEKIANATPPLPETRSPGQAISGCWIRTECCAANQRRSGCAVGWRAEAAADGDRSSVRH
jgi:hypothetical protein